MEKLDITDEGIEQDLGFHLMVIQKSLIDANLMMGNSMIVSFERPLLFTASTYATLSKCCM